MTPATMQLQRKHDELQKRIISQQQELRRVSEQLIMAKNLQRFNIPIAYNTNKQFNNNLSVHNISLYENVNDANEDIYSRYSNNDIHLTNQNPNHISNMEQISFANKTTNNGSDHEDLNSNMNSTVTSNDLEILPYQLSHEQSQVLFDNSNSSNDANLNSKNCR